jgi:hypothetical protein
MVGRDAPSGCSEPCTARLSPALVAVTWPSGARCAVAFTFDFDAEEVWLAGDPDAASKPGLLSMGAYGANVGVPELLRLLDRRGLPATFFVPGRVAEMHPDRVRDIAAAGHEVGAHGYTHRSPTALSRAEEEEELVKTKAILEGFGTAVRGYRSPAWEFSVNTLELLAAHGIGYSTNLMDRLHPYRHANGVVELPVQWILDDAAHFWFSPDGVFTTGSLRPHHKIHSMPDSGIPLSEWSGSGATDGLRAVIVEFSETAEAQTRTMIRLTKLIAWLTVVLVIGLVIQVVALFTE